MEHHGGREGGADDPVDCAIEGATEQPPDATETETAAHVGLALSRPFLQGVAIWVTKSSG